MSIYLVISIGGLLGIILHSLKSINAINKRYDTTDFKKVFNEYWAHDKLAFCISVFSFMVLLFVSSEFVNLNDLEKIDYSEPLKERLFHFRIANFIKVASVIAGYFSDSLVYGIMGVAEKRIKKQMEDQGN